MPNFYNYSIWPEIFMGINLKIDEKAGALTSDSHAIKRHGKMPARHERGTTLVEVAVASALLVLALASLYGLCGTTVKEAKGGDAAAIAEQNSIARLDQMRNLTWNNTTSPSSIAALLTMPTSSDNASTISREVISIYPAAVPPFPAPTPSPSPTPSSTPFFTVTKTPGIGPTPPSSPPAIVGEKLIRVEVTTEWVTSGTTHQRQLSTLISKSGTKTR
jgi:type II secretory pathway pseudopilin PulG